MKVKTLTNKELGIIEDFKANVKEKENFIPMSLLDFLSVMTIKYKSEFVATIDRKGNILSIGIGDSHSAEFTAEGKQSGLNGIRVIHTHPSGNCKLSDMDKTALKRNNLDCMCAVSVRESGAYDAEVGFLNGDKIETKYVTNTDYINKYGLMELIEQYDKIAKENAEKFYSTEDERTFAVIVKVDLDGKADNEADLEELESLAHTDGIEVVAHVLQKKSKPDVRFLVGQGKLEDIKANIQLYNANCVIFYNELSGSKIKNLSQFLNVKVIDRSMLILDIFAKRARTNEGKLQVELAQLKYSVNRINAYQNNARYGGGVGMRGPGETKLELDRRIIAENILKKKRDLEALKKQRQLNRNERVKNQKPLVAIVGYTNSGKSTLMNLLTKADVYAKNELFATLDTTTRNMYIDGKQVLLIDTVGFIKNLPTEFIEAFGSTLEESKYANLLVNVIDISDTSHEAQQKVTLDTLKRIGANAKVLTVYNKIDKLPKGTELPSGDDVVCISAEKNIGIDKLKQKIIDMLF